ncbi:lipase 3-like, partial [Musca vetustissima]|uniref:lipase 3-like n=1 Tax=Musca vetustissima TaxID=27455 RepID=UPI002AB7E59B
MCKDLSNFFSGWGSTYLNMTLLPDILLSTPADGSNRQFNHFLQFVKTCEFKAYDFGPEGNMLKYGTVKPPLYDLKAINTEQPMEMYFSDNDNMASLENVKQLYDVLGQGCNWNRLKLDKFNHFDFALATNVGDVINQCLVAKMQKYEGLPFDAEH